MTDVSADDEHAAVTPGAEAPGAEGAQAATGEQARRLDGDQMAELLEQVRHLRTPSRKMPHRLVLVAVSALVLLGLLVAMSLLALRTAPGPKSPTTPYVPPTSSANQHGARSLAPPVATFARSSRAT